VVVWKGAGGEGGDGPRKHINHLHPLAGDAGDLRLFLLRFLQVHKACPALTLQVCSISLLCLRGSCCLRMLLVAGAKNVVGC
jgi:hypothetical protein